MTPLRNPLVCHFFSWTRLVLAIIGAAILLSYLLKEIFPDMDEISRNATSTLVAILLILAMKIVEYWAFKRRLRQWAEEEKKARGAQ